MSSQGRRLLIIVGSVIGVVAIVGLWVVPSLVDLNRYRPQVAALITEKTGKPARIGHLALTIFPHLAVQVDDFAMGNPQNFPPGDFLQARRIYALLDAGALWSHKIVIKSLLIEQPVLHLLCGAGGHWNFENPAQQAAGTSAPANPQPGAFSVQEIAAISLDGGVISAANLLPSGQAGPAYFEAHGISCDLKDVNVGAASAAHRAAILRPPNSPWTGWTAPALAYAQEPPSQAPPIAQGSFKAGSVRFGDFVASGLASKAWVFPQQMYLDDINFKLASGSAQGKAVFEYSGPNPRYNVRTVFQDLDVAKLTQPFPQAQGKITGTMKGNLDVQGDAGRSEEPLSGVTGTGQVIIRDGKLPSLKLNQNLLTLVRFMGLGSSSGDPAAFSRISADFKLSDQVLTSREIQITGNDMDVDAAGALALQGAGELNYTGTAKLAAKRTGLTELVANISGATYADGKLAFPFELRGTLENPRFLLKSGGKGGAGKAPPAAGSRGGHAKELLPGLSKLFRKKQAPPPKP